MSGRFIVEFDETSNEGRLRPNGSYDWPPDLFASMRQVYQCSYSHDRTRTFVGTVPQVQAACRWLECEGMRVGRVGETSQAHPPVVCASCEDVAYRTRDLPASGSPCQGCGQPLSFICSMPHEGECDWQESAA